MGREGHRRRDANLGEVGRRRVHGRVAHGRVDEQERDLVAAGLPAEPAAARRFAAAVSRQGPRAQRRGRAAVPARVAPADDASSAAGAGAAGAAAAAGDRDAEPGYAAGDAPTERGLGCSGDCGAGIEALGERRRGWPPEGEEPRGEVAGLPPGAATATADGADDAPAGVPAAAAAAATAAAAPVTTTRRFTTDLIKRRHESNHTSLSYLQERI